MSIGFYADNFLFIFAPLLAVAPADGTGAPLREIFNQWITQLLECLSDPPG